MRKLPPCIVVAALGACTPDAQPPEREESSPPVAVEQSTTSAAPQPSPAADPVPSGAKMVLPVGEYRLAGADGQGVDLGHAITVSVTEREIRLASQCVTPRWTYRIEQGRMATEAVVEPICDRGRYPAEEAASAVFGSPERIEKTEANGWRISGGGRTITLFSQ